MLVVARELTKAFETIARIPLADAVAWLDADANRRRGEFVLIVLIVAADLPAGKARYRIDAEALRLLCLLLDELSPARAARLVARWYNAPRDAVYAAVLKLAQRDSR